LLSELPFFFIKRKKEIKSIWNTAIEQSIAREYFINTKEPFTFDRNNPVQI
jgi:hypothetical protein